MYFKYFYLLNHHKFFLQHIQVVFKNGILKSFLSVIGVLIKPGDTNKLVHCDLLKSKYKLSAKLFKADLDGPYPVELGNPLYPAIDETIVIIPLFYF